MNRKEVSEIRRRLRPEKNNIGHIYGCYVNSAKEIVSYVDESVSMLTQEESEKYLGLMRKSLSGALGRNLNCLNFATKQVVDSDEVRMLSALRKSQLQDEELREQFYRKVIEAVTPEDSGYVILIAMDTYDVPHFGKDGREDDNGGDVFRYILCCLCPVKSAKAQFAYSHEDKRFLNLPAASVLTNPLLGFMYPAFDQRSANIYSALFYSQSAQQDHQDFIDAVFHTLVPIPAAQQQELFNSALSESLEGSCSLELVQKVHSQLMERISFHKESKDPDPLVISPEDMGEILENCGASPEQAESFEERCRHDFGEAAELSPENLINSKQFKIEAREIKISVPAQLAELVETRLIDGRKYILIPADGAVEVNGLSVSTEA